MSNNDNEFKYKSKEQSISEMSMDEQSRRMFIYSIPKDSPLRALIENMSDEDLDQLIISGSIASGVKRNLLTNAFTVAAVFMSRERQREQLVNEINIRLKMNSGFSMQQKKFLKNILLYGFHSDKTKLYKRNEFISILSTIGNDPVEYKQFLDKGVDIKTIVNRIKQNEGSVKTLLSPVSFSGEIEARIQGIIKKANFNISNMKKIYDRIRYGKQRVYLKLLQSQDKTKVKQKQEKMIPSMDEISPIPDIGDFDD